MKRTARIFVVLLTGLALVIASTGTADAKKKKAYATTLDQASGIFEYDLNGNGQVDAVDGFIASKKSACENGRTVQAGVHGTTSIDPRGSDKTSTAFGSAGYFLIPLDQEHATGTAVYAFKTAQTKSKKRICKGFDVQNVNPS